jgi:hypothetical protein
MVRIINGEIVQDNDPRLRKGAGSQSSSSNPSSTGNSVRRVSDLLSSNNESSPQTPNNPLYGRNMNSPPPQQQQPQNPLEMIARYLNIDDRTVTIPAISAVGFSESKIGLIYFLALGLLCLIFGARTLLFGVFAYGLYKSSEKK